MAAPSRPMPSRRSTLRFNKKPGIHDSPHQKRGMGGWRDPRCRMPQPRCRSPLTATARTHQPPSRRELCRRPPPTVELRGYCTTRCRCVSPSMASCSPPQCRVCPSLDIAMAAEREFCCEPRRAPPGPHRPPAPPRLAPLAGGLPQPPLSRPARAVHPATDRRPGGGECLLGVDGAECSHSHTHLDSYK